MCKEVTLVHVHCSQLVCLVIYYGFVGFLFFVILTVNKWMMVILLLLSVKPFLEIIVPSLVLLLPSFSLNATKVVILRSIWL